ncbi:Large-conductance mechanosensitive channel [Phycisphaerales bacterium]|nr:Large-conductance mechanosensitive channel [Phycisphaerales bacterium]
MGFVKEFRDFALKGNVFDLAVGVIIGAAFGKIVTSLIENLLNPVIGLAAKVSFAEMYVMLSRGEKFAPGMKYSDAKSAGAALGYGQFVTDVINFLILAFVVFLMVKMFNRMRKRFEEQKPPPAPAGPTPEQKLLTEIRDLLAAKR